MSLRVQETVSDHYLFFLMGQYDMQGQHTLAFGLQTVLALYLTCHSTSHIIPPRPQDSSEG